MKRGIFALLLVVILTVPFVAQAAPAQQFSAGAVVGLQGTPHIWIADEQGVLHWAGDTRALAGKNVQWGNRIEVTLDQLKGMRRGDPWLSTGLVKSGDPIYLAKWESNEAQPTLLHIQSIDDVALFGIDGTNYGRMVVNESLWEQLYGVKVTGLSRAVLQGAAPAPKPTASPAPPAVPTATAAQGSASGAVFASGRATGNYGYASVETRLDVTRKAVLRVRSSSGALSFHYSSSGGSGSSLRTPWEGEITVSDDDRDLFAGDQKYIYAVVAKNTSDSGDLIIEIADGGPAAHQPVARTSSTTSSAGGSSGGCGSRGGPGYRLSSGKCASWR